MFGPEMFTSEGNQAVIAAVKKIEKLAETDLSIRNKETLTKAASPILREVEERFGEIRDTEPRGWIADKLDLICKKNGWEYEEYEGYDW